MLFVCRLKLTCPLKVQCCLSSSLHYKKTAYFLTWPKFESCAQRVNPSIYCNHWLCTCALSFANWVIWIFFFMANNQLTSSAKMFSLSKYLPPLAEDMIKSKSRQVITLYNRQDWHFQNHFHVDGNDIA